MSEPSPLLDVYPRLDIELASAHGCWLRTSDGREILDLYGGHAVTPLGHGHPELTRTLAEGHATLDFFSNSLHMPVQQRAAQRLLGGSDHLRHVHFVNSGTEANEAALHLARRLSGRERVLSFDCAFHGRTLAALGATALSGYSQRLSVPRVADAYGTLRFGALEDVERIDDSVACVLCESVPSLAGVLMPPDGYYPALEARCREAGALLVFDEVQGGIGRLGRWFAHELFGVKPDMVTLAKSIAGGYPAGALLVSGELGARVKHGELGTTFGGGPLACAMIETVARVIDEQGLLARVEAIFAGLREHVGSIDGVTLSGAGCLVGLRTPLPAAQLRARLLEHQVLVGTSAEPQTARLLPPYVLEDAHIARFAEALRHVLGH
ncbi:MAG: aspartate aminotransferase family protein [Myxococcales bacterium]|nr:aspartate aminotransferase family protein [Myxococcales bacterium]